MTYEYRKVIVSGTNEGVEGVSAGLAEISTFMQDVGWSLVDDRSTEPGTGVESTHMKYVFSSNGESGDYPTYYITLYSGTSSAVNNNYIYVQAHTAYDVGAHGVPASGVQTNNVNGITDANGDNRLYLLSQTDDTEINMAGDSEMVHVITRRVNSPKLAGSLNNAYFGRFNSFFSVEDNPYPLLVQTVPQIVIHTATASYPRGIYGNPPQPAGPGRGQMTTLSITTAFDANQPYNMGVDSIFTALPIAVLYNYPATDARAYAGTVRNGWVSADRTHLLNLSILTASGTGGSQEFISFTSETLTSTPSLIVRKS